MIRASRSTLPADLQLTGVFPHPPIEGDRTLVPIRTWLQMHHEAKETQVEFEYFWYEHVYCEVAYFFSWVGGDVRATVLVVWDCDGPTYIECRKLPDTLMDDEECAPIVNHVIRAFWTVGLIRPSQHM